MNSKFIPVLLIGVATLADASPRNWPVAQQIAIGSELQRQLENDPAVGFPSPALIAVTTSFDANGTRYTDRQTVEQGFLVQRRLNDPANIAVIIYHGMSAVTSSAKLQSISYSEKGHDATWPPAQVALKEMGELTDSAGNSFGSMASIRSCTRGDSKQASTYFAGLPGKLTRLDCTQAFVSDASSPVMRFTTYYSDYLDVQLTTGVTTLKNFEYRIEFRDTAGNTKSLVIPQSNSPLF
ncbi:hypothetical protein CSV86_010215 [Pseudomonas putida CSV86]|uniref:Uncharacterized protein n=1 Tax=Pseudomonas bharatica CSV86 TaxID=1005395 RepID=L1M486_9PSED|nr:hypothetical protein [Pseudomonas bharatica]NNJ15585.1 hypothetical protein [Pseudomonas bharatica CSV86]